MEMDIAIKRLSALAQDARLQVFRLLVKAGPDGMLIRRGSRTSVTTSEQAAPDSSGFAVVQRAFHQGIG